MKTEKLMQIILIIFAIIILIGVLIFVLKDDHKSLSECERYHYSNCPKECLKKCIPSVCNSEGICTADCDGPRSCVYP